MLCFLFFYCSSGTLEALKEEAEEHDTALKELKKGKDRATKVMYFFFVILLLSFRLCVEAEYFRSDYF